MVPNGKIILGPALRDVQALGLDGQYVDIATAFYSARALNSLSISAKEVRFLCRIDLYNIDEWCRGYIAPEALLNKIDALVAVGTNVRLFGHPQAHAKAYSGNTGTLVGSANLTMRGFGGGFEMVVYSRAAEEIKMVKRGLDEYQKRLTLIEIEELREYVEKNIKAVKRYQKKYPSSEDRLPDVPRDRISISLGSYASFLDWLGKQSGDAANETLDRANGKGNLQGHIHRNFSGLRQLFLAHPELQKPFAKKDAGLYKLSKDPAVEAVMRGFVKNHAADEEDFRLSTWKTYLPRECGGRAGKHGGTIGNLNRMLPLVSQYLEDCRPQN